MLQLSDDPPDLAQHALAASGIGGWEYDPASARLRWTAETYRLYGVAPGTTPTLAAALACHPPQARQLLEAAIENALTRGRPWDMELPLVTVAGLTIAVRSWGRILRGDGQTRRIVGALQDITGQQDRALQSNRLCLVARGAGMAISMLDAAGQVTWINEAFERLTGYTLDVAQGRRTGELLRGAGTDPITARHIDSCMASGRGYDVEIRHYTRRGQPVWMAVNCTPFHDDAGVLSGFILVAADVSRRREAEAAALHESQERWRTEAMLRDVLETLPCGITVYDKDDRFVLSNAAFADMMPTAALFAVPGRHLTDIIRDATEAGQYPDAGNTPADQAEWAETCIGDHYRKDAARIVQLPDGRFVQWRQRRSESGNLVCVRSDATELVRAEAELRLRAERDPLTILANRAALMRALQQSLMVHAAPGATSTAGTGALLLFDLDDFKQVNDRFGHDVGDALLMEIGNRLQVHTRSGDVAARLGGDEFAVVMPGLDDERAARARVKAIVDALAAPVLIGQRSLTMTVSAGVTLFPRDGQDAACLLKNADLALYDAKRGGRARWCCFKPGQARALQRRVRRADALRQAVIAGAIDVALQPKRRMDGEHAGFEALARWRDRARWVPPCEFVALSEESGLAVPLGRRVMEAALARIAALRALGLRTGSVAVNVTCAQLLDSLFLDDTLGLLRQHGLAPGDLELEVTETILLGRSTERVVKALRQARDRGITLALDDFGTGFASLAHLSRLPLDRLKIDGSFISGVDGRSGVIARTIIGLARGLDMESVAVGVETPAQLAFLRAEGCDIIQGYCVARPMLTPQEAAAYLGQCPAA